MTAVIYTPTKSVQGFPFLCILTKSCYHITIYKTSPQESILSPFQSSLYIFYLSNYLSYLNYQFCENEPQVYISVPLSALDKRFLLFFSKKICIDTYNLLYL